MDTNGWRTTVSRPSRSSSWSIPERRDPNHDSRVTALCSWHRRSFSRS